MSAPIVLAIGLGLISSWLFITAIRKSRAGNFYQDTHFLAILGIYVWGDALILAPFWLASAGLFILMPISAIVQYFLLFYVVRSVYEIIYWINHQVAKKDYQPPLFRRISWLGANEAAILYQLLHTCIVILGIAALAYTRLTLR
jgi:hypothetical protein